jgi:hypothetical protein
MTEAEISDETLMALADGELEPAESARVRAAVAADPALARRYALFSRTGELLAQAAAARRTAEPDPLAAGLRARLEAARVQPSAPATVVPLRRPPPAYRPMAIAAGLALAVGLGGGWLAGLSLRDGDGGLRMAALPAPALSEALSRLPSGGRQAIPEGEVTLVASFRNGDGELCREFELAEPAGPTVVSVACRAGDGWQTRFAVLAGTADGGYAPASSLDALDAYLGAIGVGAPLSPEEEAAARAEATPG